MVQNLLRLAEGKKVKKKLILFLETFTFYLDT